MPPAAGERAQPRRRRRRSTAARPPQFLGKLGPAGPAAAKPKGEGVEVVLRMAATTEGQGPPQLQPSPAALR